MPENFKVLRLGKLVPNKPKKEPVMELEDVVAEKQSIINCLIDAINKHKDECPDHDIRVLDQRLWSVAEIHEMKSE